MSTSPTAIMVTFSAPSATATEEDFNEWYDRHHVPEILEHVSGIARVTRYQLDQAQMGSQVDDALPYAAIYEFDKPVDEVLREFAAAQPKLTMSDTLDTSERVPVTRIYEFLGAASRTSEISSAASVRR